MDHYNIPDPYRKSKAYYIKHYVCLWQVTGAEIVGHWDWSELEGNGNWYQEIILPAFENFTAATSFTTWSHGRGLLARSNPVQSAPNVLDDLQDHLSRLSSRLWSSFAWIQANCSKSQTTVSTR
jgi:hypothetical protein